MNQYAKNIKTYFEENDRINDSFEVEDKNGTLHIIDKNILLKSLLAMPSSTQKKIVDKITQIELRNPSQINDFLTYLSKGLVN